MRLGRTGTEQERETVALVFASANTPASGLLRSAVQKRPSMRVTRASNLVTEDDGAREVSHRLASSYVYKDDKRKP